MLQKTVPIIIQTRSDEKLICTEPIWNSIIERAAVRNTNAIVRFKRFVFELKSFSRCVRIQPIIAPRPSEQAISTIGLIMIDTISA